jgi:hypothetical protein
VKSRLNSSVKTVRGRPYHLSPAVGAGSYCSKASKLVNAALRDSEIAIQREDRDGLRVTMKI